MAATMVTIVLLRQALQESNLSSSLLLRQRSFPPSKRTTLSFSSTSDRTMLTPTTILSLPSLDVLPALPR